MSGYQNQPLPVEPSAQQRTVAKEMRAFFVALVAEGFTEDQAIAIIGHMIGDK